MKLNPYLMFNGQCEEAFKFYAQCLGGQIEAMMTYADTPTDSPMAAQVTPELRSKIMHAHLTIGDMELMGSDAPGENFEKPQGFSVSLLMDDTAEAKRVFDALAEGGTIQMPLQQTFWASQFGMATDRFGTPWMINCD